jgi:hypothetical protein
MATPTTTKRIPGHQGTDPQGNPRPDEQAPRDTRPARPRTPLAAPVAPAAPVRSRLRAMADLQPAIDAARKHRDELLARPHVIDVRGGYKFINGQITDYPAVVVVVDRKIPNLREADCVPPSVEGIPTDVAPADPYELLAYRRAGGEAAIVMPATQRLLIDGLQAAEEAEEALPQTTYEPPPNGDLSAVTGAITLICHVSPDAGWRTLQPFLEATENEICLGMYDFTAPHIYQTARTVLKNDGVKWRQTLGPNESLPGEDDVDSTKADDLTEAKVVGGLKRVAGKRFTNAFAHVGAGMTFASAYHIKVAVRDKKSFWLSSGNWQSSNQPDIDFFAANADRSLIPRFNREWHVVADSPALAKKFQVYLEHDFKTASLPIPEAAALEMPDLLIPVDEFLAEETEAAEELEVFAPKKFVFTADDPLTVQPILTPDNYVEIVAALLRKRPAKTLYFQNQSLNPVKSPTPEFDEMMQLLIDYSNDPNLDVRLIFRNIGPVRKKLESLKAAGFNMKCIRMQAGCHAKGIVVDSEVVLLGSHNFTNQGIQVNRDASLLIRHAGIAKYYERVFLHDWDRLAKPTIREESAPVPVGTPGTEAAEAGTGYVRVPWNYIEED